MVDPKDIGETWKKYSEWLLYGAVAVGCYLSLPLILGAVQGLFLWLTFGAIGFAAWSFVPVFADVIANWKMKAIIAVAESNPIETMLNIYKERSVELRHREDSVTKFETEFRNVSQMVTELEKSDPEEATEYAVMRNQMKVGLESLRGEISYAADTLEELDKQIKKAQRIWKVSLAMNAALEASASAQAVVYQKIKEQVAFDTVRTNVNKAFANLNTSIERRKNSEFMGPKATMALPEAVTVTDLGNVQPTKQKVGVVR